MPALATDLRNLLQSAVIAARDVSEDAARAALIALAVNRPEPFSSMDAGQRRVRNALRAKVRQHGGGEAGFSALVEEVAYEQWHRMLFARFLAENGLLMHPSGVAVTLAECAELAPEEGEGDEWQLAARYASQMLPGIFRADDPAVQLRFALEGQSKLERILSDLPPAVFTADDSLGWVYQFWQTKKKEEVNRSGRKIGGEDLPPVTELFTEDYMVSFLLENSLGAWWAARHPDSPLLKDYTYLRFRDDGTPAAGTFPEWPGCAAEVTVMDPCCGSGHFLVAAFEMLRRMRMEEEGLAEGAAADAVIRDNLFGLELDPRCTQIAGFAVALAAWKAGGYRQLPLPNIACSGIPVAGQLEEWKKLAGGDVALEWTLERLHHLFRNASDLGSLINPADVPLRDRMFAPDFAMVEPLLSRALARERSQDDPVAAVLGAAAEGVVRAATLLAKTYTLVATNVPYLTFKKMGDTLKRHCEAFYPAAKMDLSTVFVERCRAFVAVGGTYAVVTPQNWLFLVSYEGLRRVLLRDQTWHLVCWLGAGAFATISGEVVKPILAVLSNHAARQHSIIASLDVSTARSCEDKAKHLQFDGLRQAQQASQMGNPNAVITMEEPTQGKLLAGYADALVGILSGDSSRFERFFWEVPVLGTSWEYQQSTVRTTMPFGGREGILLWERGDGQLRRFAIESRARLHNADRRGSQAWGKTGVAVTQMGQLPVTLYTGEKFDCNAAVILPKNPSHLPAIWAFCSSPEYSRAVRRITQKMNVTNATLVKVPFDLDHWSKVANESGPLPQPYSSDPTQWLFMGDPTDSTAPLQVAAARLLGYRWPEQKESDRLDALAITGGIACLPAVAGEPPAAERLRALLASAYGGRWSIAEQDRLLAQAGFAGKTLGDWLRDGFFPQHCALYHNRPFIWHIWDGRKDGFSALVNYHKLDGAALDRLIYTYLGAWIEAQRAQEKAGVPGANGRLVDALKLQQKLEAIREGEPPYDIYIRWKPLAKQPIGWEPDLNDGVRLNVRPFVNAGILRARFTVSWNKDRGSNPDGSELINDLHCTRAEKEAARAGAATMAKA